MKQLKLELVTSDKKVSVHYFVGLESDSPFYEVKEPLTKNEAAELISKLSETIAVRPDEYYLNNLGAKEIPWKE